MNKTALKAVARWVLSVGLICLSLLYLNSAAFNSWASWGPPTKYPRAYAQIALIHLGYSIALFATGIMVFIALKKDFSWRRSKYKYIWLILLILCLGYPKAREFELIDKCLDSGGSWNNEYFECRK